MLGSSFPSAALTPFLQLSFDMKEVNVAMGTCRAVLTRVEGNKSAAVVAMLVVLVGIAGGYAS